MRLYSVLTYNSDKKIQRPWRKYSANLFQLQVWLEFHKTVWWVLATRLKWSGMAIGSTRSVGAKLLERTAQRWKEVFEEATPSHLLWPPGLATNSILFYLRLERDDCREGFSRSNLVASPWKGFLCCLAFSCAAFWKYREPSTTFRYVGQGEEVPGHYQE